MNDEKILNDEEVEVESKGWIFQTANNEEKIVGIGYLKDIAAIIGENSVTLSLENGWYSLKIRGVNKNGERLFELNMQKQDTHPAFSGDVTTEYYYG